MSDKPKTEKPEAGELNEDTRTNEEILQELGFKPGGLAVDVSGSVENISDAIAARVRARLAAEGWKPSDAFLTDEEDPDPDHEADERARAEYAKKHGLDR
jgi:hypothetical protein